MNKVLKRALEIFPVVGLVALVIAAAKDWCEKPAPADHGVPNLDVVAPGIWRSGQPSSPEAWAYVKSLGITTVVKLNFEEEGSDQGAIDAGMNVIVLSIPPKNDLPSVFEKPDPAKISAAVATMESGSWVLVHCTHGQDRTGLLVGVYRVVHDHKWKSEAFREMLAHGFHPELVGLTDYWEDFRP